MKAYLDFELEAFGEDDIITCSVFFQTEKDMSITLMDDTQERFLIEKCNKNPAPEFKQERIILHSNNIRLRVTREQDGPQYLWQYPVAHPILNKTPNCIGYIYNIFIDTDTTDAKAFKEAFINIRGHSSMVIIGG